MEFEHWLKTLAAEGGSDLYLTTGAPPSAKFAGEMRALSDTPLSPGQTRTLAYDLMDEQQAREFDEKLEMNLAISLAGVGRFRVNIFKQRNEVGLVVRYIVVDIPAMDKLGLPSIAADLIKAKRGLVLVVGATGSGKSTTLASLIDHRNSSMGGHIVTIEDPVEFIHSHKKSIVNQRELGVDTRSWEAALKKIHCDKHLMLFTSVRFATERPWSMRFRSRKQVTSVFQPCTPTMRIRRSSAS